MEHIFNFFLLFSANSVYMTDAPPPYPGINGYNGYANGGAAAVNGATSEHMASAPVQTGYYIPSQPGTVFVPPRPVSYLKT